VKSAALEYAARGWPVFPCVPYGKTPLTSHGLKDATTDAQTIRAWWDATPNANVAIATGPPGPTVVDADGPIGKHEWCKFVDGIGWRATPWACTGGGGFHIYWQGDNDIRNRAGWLRKVDVRGVGGYVIAPPSVTLSDYWWVHGPDERDLAPIPARVRDALATQPRGYSQVTPFRIVRSTSNFTGNGYAAAALEGEVEKVRRAPEGVRNHTLVGAAFSLGQLVGARKLERDTVISALLDAGRSAGLPETEVLRTIASGLRAGCDTPRRR
jgi:putative DNA primase/helicase